MQKGLFEKFQHVPRLTGGGHGALKGYKGVKGDSGGGSGCAASAMAWSRKCLFKVSQIHLKIIMQGVFRSEPVMAQGHRGGAEEPKGNVLTPAAALARQWRWGTGLHWAYATNASTMSVVFEFGLHSGSSRLKREQNKVLQPKNVQE